jgi:ABC-type Fe3+ transport system permease subunit
VLAVVPALLPAYAWATLPWSPFHQGRLVAELWYMALLVAMYLPVAVLCWPLVPRSRFAGAPAHAARLLLPPGDPRCWRWAWRARLRAPLVIAALVALLTFNEFEMASLFVLDSWTVWLFDSQVQGLPLDRALGAAVLPALMQVALVLPLLILIRPGQPAVLPAPGPGHHLLSWGLCTLVAALILIIPGGTLASGLPAGWVQITGGYPLLTELRHSLVAAVAATVVVLALVLVADRFPRSRSWLGLASAPGLLGSLTIGLLGLGLVNRLAPGLGRSLFPWMTALVIIILPLALAARALLLQRRDRTAGHLIAGLAAYRPRAAWALAWRHAGAAWFTLGALVLLWAFMDLAASGLLAPPTMPPVLDRLYNLMHYGRTEALSALTLVAMVAPLLLLALVRVLIATLPLFMAKERQP